MKHRPAAVLFVVLFVLASHLPAYPAVPISTGDGSWVWQNPPLQGNDINSTCFVDQSTGWAVGDAGTILKTGDGGVNWAPQTSGTTADLYAVAFADLSNVWIAGAGGVVLRTIDGGMHWKPLTSGTTNTIKSLTFVDLLTGWAVGAKGLILKTADGGKTWQAQDSGTMVDLNSVSFASATTGWAVGASGKVVKTSDGGATWVAQSTGSAVNWNAVHFLTASLGFAAGDSGKIAKTVNSGASWTVKTMTYSPQLRGIRFSSSSSGWAVGEGGCLYKTTDSGSSWTSVTSPVTTNLNSVWAFASRACAAGDYGRTTWWSGGSTWSTNSTAGLSQLTSVDVADAATICAAGQSGVLRRDGNGAWSVPNGITNLNCMRFLRGQGIGCTGGSGGRVFSTTDNGHTWTQETTDVTSAIYSICPEGTSSGVAVGNGGAILERAGSTWISQPSPTMSALWSVTVIPSGAAWAVGDGGTILVRSSGSSEWVQVPLTSAVSLKAVCFADADHGWIVGETGTMLATSDGGATWRARTSGTSHTLYGVAFADANTGWACGAAGTILKTVNGGLTWSPQPSGTTRDLTAIACIDSTTAWVVGEYGTILHIDGASQWGPVWVKQQSDGTPVALGNLVVTGSFGGFLYAQHPMRPGGIRVDWTGELPAVGSFIGVSGEVSTFGGERVIAADSVDVKCPGWGAVREVGMACGGVGGGRLGTGTWGQIGATGGTGTNNVGLLIRVCGKVTAVDAGGVWFTIDDGSAQVRVYATAAVSAPAPGSFAAVTGVSSLWQSGSTWQRLIWPVRVDLF